MERLESTVVEKAHNYGCNQFSFVSDLGEAKTLLNEDDVERLETTVAHKAYN